MRPAVNKQSPFLKIASYCSHKRIGFGFGFGFGSETDLVWVLVWEFGFGFEMNLVLVSVLNGVLIFKKGPPAAPARAFVAQSDPSMEPVSHD